MDIQRFPGNAPGRSRAVAFDNLVFTVPTAAGSTSLQEQTRQVLARIEQNLQEAGSDKTRLLSATVYLADIAKKAEVDRGVEQVDWTEELATTSLFAGRAVAGRLGGDHVDRRTEKPGQPNDARSRSSQPVACRRPRL